MGRLRALAAGAALVVAAHGVAVAQQGEDERLGVGQPFPELALQDVHGGEVILAGRPAAGATLVVYLHPTQRLSGKLVRDMIKLLPVREDGAVVLIFSRAEGDTIAKAQEAKDRFRVLVDGDRSAHEALGIVALPSCYVVSREGVITHARRGYTVSLARELGEDLDVALGLISAEELARRRAASGKRESAATKQLHRRLNLVDARLRRGDAETALRILEPLVEEHSTRPRSSRAGRWRSTPAATPRRWPRSAAPTRSPPTTRGWRWPWPSSWWPRASWRPPSSWRAG